MYEIRLSNAGRFSHLLPIQNACNIQSWSITLSILPRYQLFYSTNKLFKILKKSIIYKSINNIMLDKSNTKLKLEWYFHLSLTRYACPCANLTENFPKLCYHSTTWLQSLVARINLLALRYIGYATQFMSLKFLLNFHIWNRRLLCRASSYLCWVDLEGFRSPLATGWVLISYADRSFSFSKCLTYLQSRLTFQRNRKICNQLIGLWYPTWQAGILPTRGFSKWNPGSMSVWQKKLCMLKRSLSLNSRIQK